MKTNWVRSFLLAFALCIASLGILFFVTEQQVGTAQPQKSYAITIDHDLSLKQMVEAGQHDWVGPYVTSKYFPLQGKGKERLVVEVVTIDHAMSSEKVIAQLAGQGLRPATIAELLAFSAALIPKEQREYPIVALGSVVEVNDKRLVPSLSRDGAGRGLSLGWWLGGWLGGDRFLAVRNK